MTGTDTERRPRGAAIAGIALVAGVILPLGTAVAVATTRLHGDACTIGVDIRGSDANPNSIEVTRDACRSITLNVTSDRPRAVLVTNYQVTLELRPGRTASRTLRIDRDCGCTIRDVATGHDLVLIASCVQPCTITDGTSRIERALRRA
jgi:hypothetical protein